VPDRAQDEYVQDFLLLLAQAGHNEIVERDICRRYFFTAPGEQRNTTTREIAVAD
jgi:hypothetical protein